MSEVMIEMEAEEDRGLEEQKRTLRGTVTV